MSLPAAAAAVLVFRSGGYYPATFGVVALVLLAAAAAAAALARRAVALPALAAVSGLAGLAAWQLASAARADDAQLARQAAELTALYAAAGFLVVVGVRDAWLPRLVEATWLIATICGVAALLTRLFPSLGSPTELRLSWPITYWNGLAALVAVGAALGISLASSSRPLAQRALAAAPVPALVLVVTMTFSRGGFALIVLVVALVAALGDRRLETLGVAIACAVPAAVLVWLATRERGIVQVDGERLPPHAAAGHRIAVAVVVSAVAAAALAALVVAVLARLSPVVRRRIGQLAAVVAIVAVVGAGVVLRPAGGYDHWLSSRVHELTQPERSFSGTKSSYLTASGNGRWSLFVAATKQWESAPLAGTGAGDFRFWWNAHRPNDNDVLNAHNLYLETMAESGLVGLVLLLTVPAALVVGTRRFARRLRGTPLAREAIVAAAVAGAMLLHAGFDWDWQLPAVMLPAVVLAFAVIGLGGGGRGVGGRTLPLLAIPFAALALLFVNGVRSAVDVERGQTAARGGHFERALALADAAARRDGSAADPERLRAHVLADLGRTHESDAAFAQAIVRSPRDYVTYDDWAGALLARNDPAAARPLLARARTLNPRDERTRLLAALAGLGNPVR